MYLIIPQVLRKEEALNKSNKIIIFYLGRLFILLIYVLSNY
jgi:hypothetical protein